MSLTAHLSGLYPGILFSFLPFDARWHHAWCCSLGTDSYWQHCLWQSILAVCILGYIFFFTIHPLLVAPRTMIRADNDSFCLSAHFSGLYPGIYIFILPLPLVVGTTRTNHWILIRDFLFLSIHPPPTRTSIIYIRLESRSRVLRFSIKKLLFAVMRFELGTSVWKQTS